MILDQRVNRVLGELEGDLVLRNHVDVYDVGLDVDDLVVEHGLHQRI